MTTEENALRNQQTLRRIESTLRVDHGLSEHADHLSVALTQSGVVIDGQLPSQHLRGRIVPMIRRAGVLAQVENRVAVG